MKYIDFARSAHSRRIVRHRREHSPVDARVADTVLVDKEFDDIKTDPAELRASLGLDDHRHPAAE